MTIYELECELEELMDKALNELTPEQFNVFLDRVDQMTVYYQDKSEES